MNMYIPQSDDFNGYDDMSSDAVIEYEVEYLNPIDLSFEEMASYIEAYLPYNDND